MTIPSSLEELREELDDIILSIVHQSYILPRGVTITANTFSNERSRIISHMEAVINDIIENSGVTMVVDKGCMDLVVQVVEKLKEDERRIAKSYLEGEK